jgi:diguanylate cyclase (GGDEF)-like protein
LPVWRGQPTDADHVEDIMPKTTARAPSLHQLAEQSEDIKELMERCATDLSRVNSGIAQELHDHGALPAVERALSKNLKIEDGVGEACEKLAVVTSGLEHQARDRNLLEHQFAAALEQEQAARHAALYDGLTDLPNRALFDDRLAHALAQAMRHGWMLAVMFIDLDDFKGINDSYGHEVGDRVLQGVGMRLKNSARSDDTVSRYGGDEFLYLAMDIQDVAQVTVVAEKIIGAIQRPCHEAGREIPGLPSINASMGIAVFPGDGISADMLMRKADAAMYVAKRNKTSYEFSDRSRLPHAPGRNCIEGLVNAPRVHHHQSHRTDQPLPAQGGEEVRDASERIDR